MSILFHAQNKHSWATGDLLSTCEHPELTKKQTKSKEWLSPNSDAFMVLQDIVTSKTILNDLKQCNSRTQEQWSLKSQNFSYFAFFMVMRSQLAVLGFNSGSGLEQGRIKTGQNKNNVCFSKITKTR